LFQRLGRLHRHERERPRGFEKPQCTIVLPVNQDYGVHALIYGGKKAPNTCILWRTEQRLRGQRSMSFPDAYRPEIELVYQEEEPYYPAPRQQQPIERTYKPPAPSQSPPASLPNKDTFREQVADEDLAGPQAARRPAPRLDGNVVDLKEFDNK